MIPWTAITGYGDTVVMLPAAAVILAWLVTGRAWSMACWWCILLTGGLCLVAVTKIAFIGWGIGIRSLDFTGISGHAMRAMAILPVIFYLLLQKSPPGVRACGITIGVLLGGLIAVSRIAIHVHSISEVVAGCVLGACIGFGFMRISAELEKPRIHRWVIALSLCTLLPTASASPAPTEHWLQGVALYLSGHERPYLRADWKRAPAIS